MMICKKYMSQIGKSVSDSSQYHDNQYSFNSKRRDFGVTRLPSLELYSLNNRSPEIVVRNSSTVRT